MWVNPTVPGLAPRGSDLRLQQLATLPQRRLTHGVGYPIGGTICDQTLHVAELRRWHDQLHAAWTSEHLSILHVAGVDGPRSCGFLMPPLQTDASVALAARNIRQRAALLGRPFAFETGVNYFGPRTGEMPDGVFFAAVAESADCGIVLDLNNLWVNARNGRAAVEHVVSCLPLERVWEVHLAGAEFAHGRWLDAHSGAVDPNLLALAAEVVAGLPNLGAIVFEIAADRVAGFGDAAFLRQMEAMQLLWGRCQWHDSPARVILPLTASFDVLAPDAWEELIARHMLPHQHMSTEMHADRAVFGVYAALAAEFRCGALTDLLPNTIRLLLLAVGEPGTRELLARYTSHAPPNLFPSDEALAFRGFIEASEWHVSALLDTLRLEAALIEAIAGNHTVQVTLTRHPEKLLADIAARRLPQPGDGRSFSVEAGVDPAPFVRLVDLD